MNLVEGTVRQVHPPRSPSDKWALVVLHNRERPLALQSSHPYLGRIKPGDRISVEANPGKSWDFIDHRSVVKVEQGFPVSTGDEDPNFLTMLSQPILAWLSANEHVCADDVYDSVMARAPGRDPRIIGRAFGYLVRQKKIHRVGYKQSVREECHHRPIAVWELVKRT